MHQDGRFLSGAYQDSRFLLGACQEPARTIRTIRKIKILPGACQEPVRTIRKIKSCQEASRILAPKQNADVKALKLYKIDLKSKL